MYERRKDAPPRKEKTKKGNIPAVKEEPPQMGYSRPPRTLGSEAIQDCIDRAIQPLVQAQADQRVMVEKLAREQSMESHNTRGALSDLTKQLQLQGQAIQHLLGSAQAASSNMLGTNPPMQRPTILLPPTSQASPLSPEQQSEYGTWLSGHFDPDFSMTEMDSTAPAQ